MIVIQITHHILPEYVDLYIKATVENAKSTRKEPGNVRFDVLQDQTDRCCFQLYEVYKDKEAQQSHLQSDHFTLWKNTVQHVFANRSINKFTAIHVG